MGGEQIMDNDSVNDNDYDVHDVDDTNDAHGDDHYERRDERTSLRHREQRM